MNNETSTPAASTPTQPQSQGSLRDGNNSLVTIVKAQIVFLLSTLTGEHAPHWRVTQPLNLLDSLSFLI